jgi:hypothetical protein
MRTILAVNRNISIGSAVIVVSDNEITLWWNDTSQWKRKVSKLQTRSAIVGFRRIVVSEAKVSIRKMHNDIKTLLKIRILNC